MYTTVSLVIADRFILKYQCYPCAHDMVVMFWQYDYGPLRYGQVIQPIYHKHRLPLVYQEWWLGFHSSPSVCHVWVGWTGRMVDLFLEVDYYDYIYVYIYVYVYWCNHGSGIAMLVNDSSVLC